MRDSLCNHCYRLWVKTFPHQICPRLESLNKTYEKEKKLQCKQAQLQPRLIQAIRGNKHCHTSSPMPRGKTGCAESSGKSHPPVQLQQLITSCPDGNRSLGWHAHTHLFSSHHHNLLLPWNASQLLRDIIRLWGSICLTSPHPQGTQTALEASQVRLWGSICLRSPHP